MRVPSAMPSRPSSVPAAVLLLAIPIIAFVVGFIAMLTFGAIANEFGASSAPGFWSSLGIAAGLSAIFSSGGKTSK